MIGKKKEATEGILSLLGQALEKIDQRDGRITQALEKIQQTLKTTLPGKTTIDGDMDIERWLETRNEVECALIHCLGQCSAFREINERIDALAAAVTKRDELEAEIVKLKKILERRGRHNG